MHRHYLFILLLMLTHLATAQDRKPVLTEANEYYAHEGYAKAAALYETLLKKNNDPALLRKLAHCYRSINAYTSATTAYKRLTESGKANPEDWTYYGDMQKSLAQYEEAKQAYSHVQPTSDQITRKIAGCDSAIQWKKDPDKRYSIQNMDIINTKLSDWGGGYYPGKESNVFFVSAYERPEVMDPKAQLAPYPDKRTNEPFYNVYVLDSSMRDFIHGLPPAFNRFRFHTGPLVFSHDGQTAFLTVTNTDKIDYEKNGKLITGKRRLNLQILQQVNGQWLPARSFTYNQPTAYSIGHAAISDDGKTLYFASDMPGGYGKTDIWYCEWKNDSTWDTPRNCGPAINTAEEDDFPVINNTGGLYFSSKGHTGMGGLDIFYVKGEKNNWQPPQNMRWPINSEGDDFYFVQKNNTEGLLSSNRAGGKGGDDIYSYQIAPTATPPVIQKNFPAAPQKDSTNTVRTLPQVTPSEKPKSGLPIGKEIELKNIYYDFDKWTIRADAKPELDKLVALLRSYPDMKITLGSHTDCRGTNAYNQSLSEKRAASAVSYLVRQGIEATRLRSQGYGETRLVNNCDCNKGNSCTEALHQQNRRTTFTILKE